MKRKNKKLTRLILAALMATGGGILNTPFAEAAEVTVAEGESVEHVYNGEKFTTDSPAWDSGATGEKSGNTATIKGTVGTNDASGIYGGYSGDGPTNNNTVIIDGGTVRGSVWGGNSGATGASGNTVTITGTPTFGAFSAIHGAAGNGDMTNNTVNVLAKITVGALVGGESYDGGKSSGNTLNIGAVGVQTNSIALFQNINFFFPATTAAKDIMLTVKNDYGGDLDLTGVTFGAAAQKGFSLAKGETVTLIKYEASGEFKTDTTLETATAAELKVPTGITTSTEYEFEIAKSGTNSIIATVTSAKENNESSESAQEYAKSPVETRAATTTFVNAGADMLASQGFAQAANAVALEAAAQAQSGAAGAPAASAFTPFAAFGGQSMRAQSGSYVDTKGFGLNIGFARELPNKQGKLLFGPVVEYGGGNYTSHLEDAAGTRGDGKAHYFGVGIMARQVNRDGFYYEGSVRGGRVTSDYRSFINNQIADYDSSSNYWAAHVGVGKAFNVGGSNTLDGYLKYFYSHQAGDDVTIHGSTSGDQAWSFDSVDSHRIRIGARLTHKMNEKNSLYGGLAYQYEFGGEARAHYSTSGVAPSPSVKGSSGMLELGWQVKPGGPLTLDLGFTGWAGKQRGGSVQLGATWTF